MMKEGDNNTLFDNMSVEEIRQIAKTTAMKENFKHVDEARDYYERAITHFLESSTVSDKNEKIVQLWCAWTEQEIELRQYKQATKVFENATKCHVGKQSLVIWLKYAEFCTSRNKLNNAKKAYLRALDEVPMEMTEEVWKAFYQFAKVHIDKNLTIERLKDEVNVAKMKEKTSMAGSVESTLVNGKTDMVAISGDHGEEIHSANVTSVKTEHEAEKKEHIPNEVLCTTNSKIKIGFLQLPAYIPYETLFPTCPYLLFDGFLEKEPELESDVVDNLSQALANDEVFPAFRKLAKEQYLNDLDNLFRYQDIIATQLQEGKKLYQRHAEELKNVSSSDKEKVLEDHKHQLREYSDKCRLVQQVFLSRIGKHRHTLLKQQQSTLKSFGMPSIQETINIEEVNKQRAVVSLILEADKLYNDDIIHEDVPSKSAEEFSRGGRSQYKNSGRTDDRRNAHHGRRDRSRERKDRSSERQRRRRNEDNATGTMLNRRVTSIHQQELQKQYANAMVQPQASSYSLLQRPRADVPMTPQNPYAMQASNAVPYYRQPPSYPGYASPAVPSNSYIDRASTNPSHYANQMAATSQRPSDTNRYYPSNALSLQQRQQQAYAASLLAAYSPYSMNSGVGPVAGLKSDNSGGYRYPTMYQQPPPQQTMTGQTYNAKPIDPRRQPHSSAYDPRN